jgi:predicted RNase H-like HicB family nuclease
MNIDDLMMLPWTWQGPRPVAEGDEITHYELRVAELPDFFVAGESAKEAREEAAPALRAFLESYLEAGDLPPMPTRPDHWVWLLERAVPKADEATAPATHTQRLDCFQVA